MKHLLIVLVFLFSQNYLFSQDVDTKYLVNKWKVVSFGGETFPDDESLVMIFEFDKNNTVTIGSQFAKSSAEYKLIDGNKIEINAEGMNEIWEIRVLNEKEFVFWEENSGEVKLVYTDMDFPEPPIEEPEIEEPDPISIDTDYKGSKKTPKLLSGTWNLVKIGKIEAPEDVKLQIVFYKDGKIEMLSNGEKNIEGKWELNAERKIISVTGDLDEEKWGIKTLDKKNLVIVEARAGEIVMVREPKKKKKK